jgi:hypothetical protein
MWVSRKHANQFQARSSRHDVSHGPVYLIMWWFSIFGAILALSLCAWQRSSYFRCRTPVGEFALYLVEGQVAIYYNEEKNAFRYSQVQGSNSDGMVDPCGYFDPLVWSLSVPGFTLAKGMYLNNGFPGYGVRLSGALLLITSSILPMRTLFVALWRRQIRPPSQRSLQSLK